MKKNERALLIQKTISLINQNPKIRPCDVARELEISHSTATNILKSAMAVASGKLPLELAIWPKGNNQGRPKKYIILEISLIKNYMQCTVEELLKAKNIVLN
ncbi:MAG: hypothetical protein NZM04_00835 [Methylacidiphilales bacterium]|nr:hypothetical protein [Candidatus Methylacidiphilales bacterium]